ncbi:MAG: hypothetical protein N2512_09345 [Armatimonadetes bacterium]|nr:hypothetical protein [Armatimonadota bacterium]
MADERPFAHQQSGQNDLEKLWQRVNEQLRRGPVNRGLWDAALTAKPITIEGDLLVLGVPPREARYVSYLETAVNRRQVLEILHSITGRPLDFRVIEGTGLDDWERVKEVERLATERASAGLGAQVAARTSTEAWEQLGETLLKMFSGSALRYPLNLAQTFNRALAVVYETDFRVRAEDPENEALHDKHLNRICERLATHCELPATLVALEYLRYRARRQSECGQQ